jgi:hypothetical protein
MEYQLKGKAELSGTKKVTLLVSLVAGYWRSECG